ncbi:hypothetical protein NUITMVRA1_19730 [Aerococcus viridans]|nr:hypothetical protein NUITMVRA1_19730 [Aerococcus viridans]
MKNFLNYNLANMTYIYSVLVLLNAISSVIRTDNKQLSSLVCFAIEKYIVLQRKIHNVATQ